MADINLIGPNSMFTSLQPNITTQNPDDSHNRVPYEKGYFFLKYLEMLTNEGFINKYFRLLFSTYAYVTVTDKEIKHCFIELVK